jgi:flavin-dependent dehydrogenase
VSSSRRFDVVVVGGGPGGSSAAIACAEAGLRVAVLERECFPRHLPGETLHPGIEPLLRRLGVLEQVLAAAFLRHEGHWVRWGQEEDDPSPARWMPFGKNPEAGPPWHGFQAWRAHFDTLLLQRARDAGATVYQSCGAVDLLRGKAGRVTGVVKSPKRSGTEGTISAKLRTRFVVDATGGRHWLARRLALAIERHSPRLIARYGYVDGACPGRDEAPALVADSDGWTWTARVLPRRYAWTRLSLRDPKGEQHLLPPEELRGDGLHQWGKIRGADVGWRVVVPAAGQGYFLVGDAATVLDPASSHGVLKAIMSGIMAAHLIAQVVCYDASESAGAQRYSDWIRLWFDHDVAGLLALYGRLPKPPSWVRERGSFSGPPRGRDERRQQDRLTDAG